MSDVSIATSPPAQGKYLVATMHDSIAYSAGMTPRIDGVLQIVGTVGDSVSAAHARAAAGLCAQNALAAIASLVGGMDRVQRCLRMTVYVACSDDFIALSAVADGASAAIAEILGMEALPARAAIGVKNLPSGAPVEVDITAVVNLHTEV
ncbi:RidA family protein [Rhodococcus sp. IEGM 1379]|uniref:RidA family protein n=1 Tax=Rhodococcus sp. IEGM 1379 TaxID=3047086 RepID=UPI0024B81FC9|nr:RidA family protein [Rhodococcus sp. IEGM 1379]MDI9915954.1 RidA family protein [Rhodococcus sp. IEGM 1379]